MVFMSLILFWTLLPSLIGDINVGTKSFVCWFYSHVVRSVNAFVHSLATWVPFYNNLGVIVISTLLAHVLQAKKANAIDYATSLWFRYKYMLLSQKKKKNGNFPLTTKHEIDCRITNHLVRSNDPRVLMFGYNL